MSRGLCRPSVSTETTWAEAGTRHGFLGLCLGRLPIQRLSRLRGRSLGCCSSFKGTLLAEVRAKLGVSGETEGNGVVQLATDSSLKMARACERSLEKLLWVMANVTRTRVKSSAHKGRSIPCRPPEREPI